jgi:hypothetical protein
MRRVARVARLVSMSLVDYPPRNHGPEAELTHEFWRMQLLDELHRRLQALDWSPSLDPYGVRRSALRDLIARYEAVEARYLVSRNGRRASQAQRAAA